MESRFRGSAWPKAAAYRDAVVDPVALADPQLRARQIEVDRDGRPKTYDGSAVAVFHFLGTGDELALRCFTHAFDRIDRRYTAIAELLSYVRNEALCRTAYVAEGVNVGGTWWPTVTMEWVRGDPLDVAVANRLGDSEALLDLAAVFRKLVNGLEVLGVAHGDLQHDNIRVVAGNQLRLIDYDLMFVPALSGLDQAGFGHRNYQHPHRPRASFDARLDRFSAIVIYTSLIALAAQPSLWERFHDGANLIFRAHDFTAPGSSPLIAALRSHAATYQLAGMVIAASRGPVEDAPALEHVIRATAGTILAEPLRLHLPSEDPRPAAGNVPERRTRSSGIPLVPAAIGAILLGLMIGAGMSARHHASLVSATPAPLAIVSLPPLVTPAPTRAPTPAPTRPPTPAPTRPPTAAPTPATTSKAAANPAALGGAWRIDESNRVVGEMVWSADDVRVADNRLIINAHKAVVAGRSATPCERATTLHAVVPLSGVPQRVPYRETNCAGETSSGEVRIRRIGNDSIAGSFYLSNGAKLGDFTGSKE